MAKTATKQVTTVVGGNVSIAYPTIGKSVSLDYDALSPAMQRAAGIHGLKQKLGDAKSGGTAGDKYEMAGRIIEAILGGDWELRGESEGGQALLILALAEHTGKDAAYVTGIVKNATDEQLVSWKKHSKVASIMKNIAAARAAEKAAAADDDEIVL